ncbi:hypothetical protein MLD38_025060 [Melastoma candidum]|uniref:Uncharacterized protein n=1 Tax=Melastoma candidum TaxID=119954 RepID=A0ACB9NTX4_9MYRT|nr:hypothetical protein MLD38_025060 [Melastoma candidum]
MGTPENLIPGSHVWVQDPELAWIDGQVQEIRGDEADILLTRTGEKVVSELCKLFPKDEDAPEEGLDDMTKLSYFHEPGVLHNLATRFTLNKIYTYTGNILIAINPFQRLDYLDDLATMEKYKGLNIGELSPHVFAIADGAYRAMIEDRRNNSILVSGESGAGKTETTKMIMRYLAFLGGHANAERSIEQQVLESNPVLEAFGNAKTVRNNNSSRFGKFMEIQFDNHGRISGAAIRTYLLERSRVCQISDPERNYHCFYHLCAAPTEEKERYKLGDPSSFHYLNQSNCYKLDNTDDHQEYLATRKAMSVVGITEEEQDSIFRIIAAILHLGNIEFTSQDDANESAEVKAGESKHHLETTTELLMCDREMLEDVLCRRLMITPEETIKKSLDPEGAAINRDGLAKTIYSRLFDWLVAKINVTIGQDPSSQFFIGVLDIYGFESFQNNSFEQFCINYTNEKLQQHFNHNIFKTEQEDYKKEDIDWSYVEFIDNQDVLELIEKKPGGIIALLDEACMFPKSTHETFSEKLFQSFKSHKRFFKPKKTRSDFTIVHYAGEVQYQSELFIDKNKDYIVPEHQELLSSSRCSFLAALFPPISEEAMKSSKFSSIGSRFKQQVQQLMEILNSTEPHYIRCIKPNDELRPHLFENVNVLQQLRSGGVLEAIQIKCAGYPTRKTFFEFLKRFAILAPEVLYKVSDEREATKRILEKLVLEGYQIGKTKVFLRAGHMAELDSLRLKLQSKFAVMIQGRWKARNIRKEYVELRNASVNVQSRWKGKLASKLFERMKKEVAATKIQKNARSYLCRMSYAKLRASCLVLQCYLRAMHARNVFEQRKRTNASITIQSNWRRHRDQSYFQQLKRTSILMQNKRRQKVVQTLPAETIPEDDDTSVECLLQQKERLQKRVDELTSSLQAEQLARAELKEAQNAEIERLHISLSAMRAKVDEATALLFNERGIAQKIIEDARQLMTPVRDSVHDAELIKTLNDELERLKDLSEKEKERGDEYERKYNKLQDLLHGKSKKLQETERRLDLLKDHVNRMFSSISAQVSELKSSISDHDDGGPPFTRSSSSDSDFTFQAPVSSTEVYTSFHPNRMQMTVQDVSDSDNAGPGKWENEKERAFDDYF